MIKNESDYRQHMDTLDDREVARRLVLVQGKSGALAYLPHSGIPFFVPDCYLDAPVEYGSVDDYPWVIKHAPEGWEEIDGYRALLGKIAEDVENLENQSGKICLQFVPTTVCAMSCGYCYAGDHVDDYEKASVDFPWMDGFLKRHAWKFGSVIVYGGDSLMLNGLAPLMRNHLPDSDMCFVTGLGYPTNVMKKKVEEAIGQGVRFTLSIDPPPEPGEPYTRKYKLYPTGWYEELMDRVGWITRSFKADVSYDGRVIPNWGVRPSITRGCYDFRKLREDLKKASGLEHVYMNVEPAVGNEGSPTGVMGEDPLYDTVVKVDKLLDADIEDIAAGRLDIRSTQYFLDKARAILSPSTHFSPGGCYDFMGRISLGPRGEVSFCNEVPTYEAHMREGWVFGQADNPDAAFTDRYVQIMRKIYDRPEMCRKCDHRYTCGTHCPIKMIRGEVGGCMFTRLKGEKILKLIANIANAASAVNSTLNIRMDNLKKWMAHPVLTDERMKRHAQWLMR